MSAKFKNDGGSAKAGEKAVYYSTKTSLTVRLKPPRKMIVNGEVIKFPGLNAEFTNGEFVTNNQEVIDLLDEGLVGEKAEHFGQLYWKAPTKKQLVKMAEVAKRMEEAKKAAIAEFEAEEDAKSYETFNQLMAKRAKKQPKTVSGMKTVVNSNRSVGDV